MIIKATPFPTYEWFYCRQILDFVATDINLCEHGTALEHLQATVDTIIAQFQLEKRRHNHEE